MLLASLVDVLQASLLSRCAVGFAIPSQCAAGFASWYAAGFARWCAAGFKFASPSWNSAGFASLSRVVVLLASLVRVSVLRA